MDDAFAGASLRGITVEGACKQDGTPSPDNPVPIQVIEHPVLCVTGRSLLDLSTLSSYTAINGNNGKWYESYSGNWYANRTKLTFAFAAGLTLTMSVSSDAETTSVFFYDYTGAFISRVYFKSKVYSFAVPENTTYVAFEMHKTIYNSGDVSVIVGSKSNDYRPYTSANLPITLPAEHPYLAKLPDGTADEIVVDEEGNVELVANVQKIDLSNLSAPNDVSPLSNGLSRYAYWNGLVKPAKNDSPCITPNFESVVDFYFPKQGCYASAKNFLIGAATDPTDTLKASGYAYSTLKIPEHYSLGKIDMPKAQDSIFNVWTDAEVTPNTGIEYVRDVNIVVANLESAIASITQG